MLGIDKFQHIKAINNNIPDEHGRIQFIVGYTDDGFPGHLAIYNSNGNPRRFMGEPENKHEIISIEEAFNRYGFYALDDVLEKSSTSVLWWTDEDGNIKEEPFNN